MVEALEPRIVEEVRTQIVFLLASSLTNYLSTHYSITPFPARFPAFNSVCEMLSDSHEGSDSRIGNKTSPRDVCVYRGQYADPNSLFARRPLLGRKPRERSDRCSRP